MTVYVDKARIPLGGMLMSHLWADTLPELLAMVDRIGVARKWLQKPPKAQWVHFDISEGKRKLALIYGAIETDRYGPLEHEARQLLASPDPVKQAEGRDKLQRIELLRRSHRDQSEIKRIGPPPEPEQGALF